MARRGKYEEWLTENGLLRIESWASDGLTNQDISDNMGIHRDTFNQWQKRYSDISDALKKGREPVTRKLENTLIKKALGFEYDETKTFIDVMPDGKKKQRIEKFTHYSTPDTGALIFLLKNYKPDKYRNYNELTKKQIEMEIKKAEIEAKVQMKELEKMEIDDQDDVDDGFLEALNLEGEKLWDE